jgi:hypothetical protein
MSIKKLSIFFCLLVTLSACDRNDYVTWQCKIDPQNMDEKPITMILEGATMKMNQQTYNFCGSLGPSSYFDLNCLGKAEQSSIRFISKSGTWIKGDQTLSCVSL